MDVEEILNLRNLFSIKTGVYLVLLPRSYKKALGLRLVQGNLILSFASKEVNAGTRK